MDKVALEVSSMQKKVFLDIGAHKGESLSGILNDDYLFDEIHCFEPMPEPFAVLKKCFEGKGRAKVFFHNFGLADFSGEQEIYGKDVGASMFADKVDIDNRLAEKCAFVRATDFYKEHLNKEDLIIMKLNCEGGEIAILNDLLDSGEIFKNDHMMIDFDARKIPSMHDKPREVLRRLKEAKYKNYYLRLAVIRGETPFRNWLGHLPCANQIVKTPLTTREKIYAHIVQLKGYLPLKRKYK